MLNLADRGFFSMSRWIRFSRPGAHLLWRVKNSARSVPSRSKPSGRWPTGRSWSCCARAAPCSARDAADKTLPRLPDTVARLVSFTVLTRARSGRMKTTAIGVLTTLLDPDLYPARELAALYPRRWPSAPSPGCTASNGSAPAMSTAPTDIHLGLLQLACTIICYVTWRPLNQTIS